MLINLPNYSNNIDGTNCAQCVALSVLKHFFPKRKYTIEELAQKMKKKPKLWTYTHQILMLLWKEGLEAKMFSNFDLKDLLEGEKYILKNYEEADAKAILKNIDMPIMLETLKKALTLNLHTKKNITTKDLTCWLDKGYPIIVNVDWSILYEIKAPYDGHFVVLLGYDKDCFYFHENGSLKAHAISNQKVNKKRFIKAKRKEKKLIVVFELQK